MPLSIQTDEFGRMICAISGKTEATVTCADFEEAAAGLQNALDQTAATGLGECYWPEGVGEYRWVFRRVDSNIRVAVLWSEGTMTGWEHVFWGEEPLDAFLQQATAELARTRVSSGV